jgi:integrase
MAARKIGRKLKSRNKGYFYRSGRGWYATEGARKVPLTDEFGEHIKDPKADAEVVREAHARYLVARKDALKPAQQKDEVSVLELCQHYLSYCKATNSDNTYRIRSIALFDFCIGLPASMRDEDGTKPMPSKKAMDAVRIHRGFGAMLVAELLPLHVDQWLAAHPTWKGSRRTMVNAVRRALNYGVKAGILSKNPIKGYAVPKDNVRNTYITPDLEEAMYAHANSALKMAIQVLIRTGARYGQEFCPMTAAHVMEHDKGLEIRYSPDESKNRKLRVIRVTDPKIMEIIRNQIAKYPKGPIFRNTKSEPWKPNSFAGGFKTLIRRLQKKGIKVDDGMCPYSCRHTFAKRTLQGFWTRKKTNIETLSKLMGNSRDICWKHYAEWCDTYTDPLWDAA